MAVTRLLFFAFLGTLSIGVYAGSAQMELTLSSGLVAEAEYWPGAANKPAILIVHGFLQTHEFPTVRRLAESLADEGYSVLTPSLSLGIERRQQSLACEAIHTHSMAQDVAELLAWTDWLAKRAGKRPVLIGHSTGGVQLAAMFESRSGLPVERLLMLSLVYFADDVIASDVDQVREHARIDRAAGDRRLRRYGISYCREYVTTPELLLSYLDWDADRLSNALARIPVPVTVVIGDKDEQVDPRWLESLRQRGISLRFIAGADHFFDLEYEFDLLDEVVMVISGAGHG